MSYNGFSLLVFLSDPLSQMFADKTICPFELTTHSSFIKSMSLQGSCQGC